MKYAIGLMLIAFISGCAEPEPTDAVGVQNQGPIIKELSVDPPAIRIGGVCIIKVVAEDTGGGELSYEWSASAGDIIGKGNTIRYTASFCCAGFNTVKVTVKNVRGGSSTQRIDVFVN